MTRRTRRRLAVVAVSAAIGTSAPVWAPPLLSRLPAFHVDRVSVTGTHFLHAADVLRLMDLGPTASVWEDTDPWAARIAAHPLVRDVSIRRTGLHTLEVAVLEVEPVAFVPASTLLPVDADGRVVPLDPAQAELDLPIIGHVPAIVDGRVTDDRTEALLALLVELRAAAPGFVRRISELHIAQGGAAEMRLMDGSRARRVLLPLDEPIVGLLRAELAIRAVPDSASVRAADARFRNQVVLDVRSPG